MPHLNPTWQLAVATAGVLVALAVGFHLAGWRRTTAGVREAAVVTVLYAAWQLIGTITHRDVSGAQRNALTVLHLEQALHLPSELGMQQAILAHHWLVEAANGYYLYGHFNPTIAMLGWLWWRHRGEYGRIRLLLCELTAVAFVVHFWAVAPPRLMPDLGFHDVAAEYGQSVYGSFGQGIPGQLLAMPSLHVGWAVLVAYAVITCSTSRWRWLVLLHPAAMSVDVAVTANHWWLDGAVSAVILAACTVLTRRLRRMSVRRVMGTETEYGVSTPTDAAVNPMMASSQVVNGYAGGYAEGQARDRRTRWDFEEENPLRDARGFEVGLGGSDHYPGEPDEELGLANVILTNGARLYVDHAHPEYSTPEVTTPRDLVLWDKAGERVMRTAAERALLLPGSAPIRLYKNNTDNKGASYGTHENYLMARQTPFAEIVRHLTPFFVSRQVVVGAGRLGIGQDGREHGFQLSQRADFFEVEVGLETTLKRPIINTRDEPHADPEKYRRLHVIIGDANLAETSTYLKVGTTCLVLAMIEDGWLRQNGPDLTLDAPVAALRAISHDPTLSRRVTLRDGRTITGLELQLAYCEQAKKHVEDRLGADVDPQTADVLARWESTLDRLAMDPMSLADELDWVAKLALLEGYRQREGLDWDAPKLHLVDLQYADVRQDKGLYNRLVARGSMRTLVDEAEVERAVAEPPEDTRAYFRGRCLAKFPTQVAAASWDSVIFDVGRESLQRVPTMEPLRGSKAHVGRLLDECDSALELVERLAGGR